jgi:hypothetical protein
MITPEILTVIVWPFVVLVIGILVLFLFKKDIRNLLNRLKTAKWPGGTETSFNYGDADVDKAVKKEKSDLVIDNTPSSKYMGVKWDNSGNVFWLGHDLVWTIDVIIRGAPRDTIVHGLRQSLHHIRSLGFTSTPIESRLNRLMDNAEKSLEEDWTPAERNKYADEVATIIGYIGKLAEGNQADFKP